MVKRGLLIGRYQPFHYGHLYVVKQVLSEVDELIIGVGSAQVSHTLENHFTAGERILMISKALIEEGIPSSRYLIIPIPDIWNNALWVSHVCALTPPFHVVYTGNPLAHRLFKEAGFDVRAPPPYDRAKFSGTEVRKRMLEGCDWKSLVPPAVAKVIEEIGGVERLKDISKSDKLSYLEPRSSPP